MPAQRSESLCTASEAPFEWAPSLRRAIAASLNSPYWSQLSLIDRPPRAKSAKIFETQCPALLEGRCAPDIPADGEIHSFIGFSATGHDAVIATRPCEGAFDGEPRLSRFASIERWNPISGRRGALVGGTIAAALSADGAQLAVIRASSSQAEPEWLIANIDVETTEVRVNLSLPANLHATAPTLLSWAPKGMAIAIADDDARLRAIVLDSSLRPMVAEPALFVEDNPWTPDGSRLAARTSTGDVVLLHADTLERNVVMPGVPAEVHWSPRGDRFVTWPHARREASAVEPAGLERFLPPTTRADWQLADAQIIDRHFEAVLANVSPAIDSYPFIVIEYAQALERLGRRAAAEAVLCNAIARIGAMPTQMRSGRMEPVQRALASLERCAPGGSTLSPFGCATIPGAQPGQVSALPAARVIQLDTASTQ